MNKEKTRNIENKLYNYNRLETEIENLRLDLKEIETLKGMKFGERSAANAFNSGVEDAVVKKEEIENKIIIREIQKMKIENVVNSSVLNTKEKEFIEAKYFKDNSNIEIADLINISPTSINKYRIKTLRKIEGLI